MIQSELRHQLELEGVSPSAYDLDGTQKDEACCLERRRDAWVYYYRERGFHRDEHVFTEEAAAVHHFLGRVLEDPTTRVPPLGCPVCPSDGPVEAGFRPSFGPPEG